MKLEPQTNIFISRSGGGKGTQIALLRQYFEDNDLGEVVHIELGNTFREFFKRDTYVSNLAKEVTNKGELQPSFLAIWAWANDFIDNLKSDKQHLFIDGTPRQVDESMILVEALNFFGRQNFNVIYINVSKKCAMKRMSTRSRTDDNEEGIEKRMNWFDVDVLPVLNEFKKNKKCNFIEVDGEQEIDDIYREIIKKLEL